MKRIHRKKFENFVLHELDGQIQSIFLVEYPEAILLLDSGCKCDAIGIRDFISLTLHRPLSDLKTCVVSHMHPDHAGGALSLRKYTGCQLVAQAEVDRWYRGIGGFFQHKVDTYLAWWVSRKRKRQKRRLIYPRAIRPDVFVQDGDIIPGFPEWRAIHTPGHTSHDICISHSETGLLYVGDVMVRIKEKLLPPFPVTLPKVMCESLSKIEQLEPTHIMMAHGGILNLQQQPISFDDLCKKVFMAKGLTFRFLGLWTYLNSEIRKAKRRKWDYH